ncbi:MAG: undecaprenyl/decaprenyl-phosphate alpha-N-acetylglucosaminyl 1-phosphate transferase [Lentisphaerae bacterium]|nr:undecaprenyl/decaprenyl-phosphate alpha-N-acetylglucosaminyl 1-phosphate transferase [Lentisphaerota bacterium]
MKVNKKMLIQWYHIYFLALLGGTAAVLLLTPLAQKLAAVWDIMDRPKGEKHKFHGAATPLLGGAAMFSGWLLMLAAGLLSWHCSSGLEQAEIINRYLPGAQNNLFRIAIIAAGAAAAVLLGTIDDIKGLKAHWKFLGQLLIALLAAGPGEMRISLFISAPWISYVITVFWFMMLMNAINFFDNMDGLAAGTAAIALILFTVAAGFQQQYFIATLSALGAGCALGFWFYNYTPASIFMGDGGSHFLGYLLAVASTGTTYFNPAIAASKVPVLIPLCILAVPIFDAMTVTVVRTLNGKPFWIGDHNHISHRFVRMGLSRKRAVQLVHILCLLTGLSSLPILWSSLATTIVISVQMLLLLMLITILQYAVIPHDLDSVVPPDKLKK